MMPRWTRRGLLRSSAAALGGLSLGAFAGSSRPPNIVLMMMDDGSRDWLGCYGSGSAETPNVDALADSGVRFKTFYATPLCTPTRVALLTGKYPFRTGWTRHHDAPRWGGQYFDWKQETTFARLLRDAGYSTGLAGKWQVNDLRAHPQALSLHGFDEHCLWPGFETGNPSSAERYWNAYLVTNGNRRTHQGEFGPDVVNRFAVDFIRRNKSRPFLLYYPFILPHSPYVPTPVAPTDSTTPAILFKGMIEQVDRYVGNILRTLDESGTRENTLVLFTGDNGSSVGGTIGDLDLPPAKGKCTDLGAHVPLIASWPTHISTGGWTEDLADASDVFPTLLDCAGMTPPGDLRDGRSFLPTLRGEGGSRRSWIFSQLTDLRTDVPRRWVRDARYLLYDDGRFFDVEADPLETTELSASQTGDHKESRESLQKIIKSLPKDKVLEGFPPDYKSVEPPKVG